MKLKTLLSGKMYSFKDIKDVLAKANEEKSGDVVMGIAAMSNSERVAARIVLANLTLDDIRQHPVIPLESDEVSRIIDAQINEPIYQSIKNWTLGYLREWILFHETSATDLNRVSRGLNAEMIAGVTKLMSAMDLVYGAKKISVPTTCLTTVGLPGTLSFRLQPNHPADSIDGIIASTMEGLSYGSGDAVIGINPVEDNVENTTRILEATWNFIQKWNIPTQNCVLAHLTTQMAAVQKGAPACMLFQSIAGTEAANTAFGLNASLVSEAFDLIKKLGVAPGPNLMYFETGQGSEMSLGTDCGVDMMTLEARTYGFCKKFMPFMVNNVSGFIGPETLYDGRQVIRASLEDHFMGKLTGLPMGMAPCYTNHTKIDQSDQEMATMLLAMAGANYYMGLPMGDDVMLAYQDTGFHDDATLREILRLKPAPDFHQWLMKMDIMDATGRLTARAGDASIFS